MDVALGSTWRAALRFLVVGCFTLAVTLFVVSNVRAASQTDALAPAPMPDATVGPLGSIEADTVAPSAKISARVSKCVWKALRLEVRASDASGVASVDFSIDSEKISATLQAPYEAFLSVRGLARGSHTVVARVRDNAGNITVVSKRFRHCAHAVRVQRQAQPRFAG